MRRSQSSVCGSLAPIIACAPGGRISIVVRMLVADDAVKLFGTGNFKRASAGQIGNPADPSQMGLGSRGVGRDDEVRPVEAAGGEFNQVSADRPIAERRSTGSAKIALGDRRRAEGCRFAACPREIPELDVGQRYEWAANRFLTHPAVAQAYFDRGRIYREPNGAALTAAGQNSLSVRCHAHSIRRQVSCNVASASPPAKMKSPTPAARSAVSWSPGRP